MGFRRIVPDWKHLKRFGYAPGDYMNLCSDCGETVTGVDKRAQRCRPCAEKRYAEHMASVASDPPPTRPAATDEAAVEAMAKAMQERLVITDDSMPDPASGKLNMDDESSFMEPVGEYLKRHAGMEQDNWLGIARAALTAYHAHIEAALGSKHT